VVWPEEKVATTKTNRIDSGTRTERELWWEVVIDLTDDLVEK
jgi:hypothetical protein